MFKIRNYLLLSLILQSSLFGAEANQKAGIEVRLIRLLQCNNKAFSVALNSNNTLVAVLGDKNIRFWNAETGELLQILKHHNEYYRVKFEDNKKIYVKNSNFSTQVFIHENETWKNSNQDLEKNKEKFKKYLCYNDSFKVKSDNTKLEVYNEKGVCKTLKGHTLPINNAAFNPNGTLLASASSDKTIKLWNPETGELLKTLEGHTDRVNSVAFSSGGTLLASASSDKKIRLWNPETGQLLQILKGHKDRVNSVAFSPGGLLLASGSSDNTIRLWQIKPPHYEPRTSQADKRAILTALGRTF